MAILAAILGILSIIEGITLMTLGPMLAAAGPRYRGMGLLIGMAVGLGALLLVIGLLDLVVAWGYWTAKSGLGPSV